MCLKALLKKARSATDFSHLLNFPLFESTTPWWGADGLGSWEPGKIGKKEFDMKSCFFFLASQLLIFLAYLFEKPLTFESDYDTDYLETG